MSKAITVPYEENHRINNGVLEKKCNRCNTWFPCTEEYFYKNQNKTDGLFTYCKKCNIKKSQIRYEENKESISEYKRIYYSNNIEIYRQTTKRTTTRRPEYYKQKAKEFRQNNPDRVKQYNEKHQHKKHKVTTQEWKSCKEYFNHKCAYCGISEFEAKKKYNQYFHKEHVDDDGSLYLDNCVPSCKGCNSSKREFTLDWWYDENNHRFSQERLNRIIKWTMEDYKLYFNKKKWGDIK